MKKQIFTLCLALALCAGQAAAATTSLLIDYKEVAMEATLYQDTTYVSLRQVVEYIRPYATVEWQDNQAVITTPDFTLTAREGDTFILYNGTTIPVPCGVRLEEGYTLLPIRILMELLGGTVDWNPDSGLVSISTWDPTDDLYWLSHIISAESRGESYAGQIAVGNVVLNRVASDQFPDSIYQVIFDQRWGGQFAPVHNGTVYLDPAQSSVSAAQDSLDGENVVDDSLYFIAPDLTDNHWTMNYCEYVTTIGCHWFYR